MNTKLVIWGASGHALVIADIIRLQSDYEIIGFIDDVNPERHNKNFCRAIVLGGKEQLEILQQKGVRHLIFGFGNCKTRLELSPLVKKIGFTLVNAIHSSAVIAEDVLIGSGSVIVAGAVINPGARIDENVIINTCASVDHGCIIEEGVHVGPGTHLGAEVVVERGAWIGMGTTIKDRVRIGSKSVIGAGSLVLDDIPKNVLAYGAPVKIIKEIANK